MKALLKVNYKIWVAILIVIASSITVLVLLLNMSIEKTFKTSLIVDDQDVSSLIIKNKGAYLINEGDKITLIVNSEFIPAKIKDISYDGDENEYKIELIDNQKKLLPNTTIEAEIIYDSHTVFNALFNPGV